MRRRLRLRLRLRRRLRLHGPLFTARRVPCTPAVRAVGANA
ncbi:hypothetical protein [Streptomyces sp. enrichment culture]